MENHRKQSFEVEANNRQLDKEYTKRNNLNSKYLSVIPELKYPDFLFVIIVFSNLTCKVRFDISKLSPSKRFWSVLFLVSSFNRESWTQYTSTLSRWKRFFLFISVKEISLSEIAILCCDSESILYLLRVEYYVVDLSPVFNNLIPCCVRLFSNRSQMTSKCGKNKPSVSLMFLLVPHHYLYHHHHHHHQHHHHHHHHHYYYYYYCKEWCCENINLTKQWFWDWEKLIFLNKLIS